MQIAHKTEKNQIQDPRNSEIKTDPVLWAGPRQQLKTPTASHSLPASPKQDRGENRRAKAINLTDQDKDNSVSEVTPNGVLRRKVTPS